MNIYFDTEFTGLHKGTSLVSIGLVSEDGKEFYAELTDFDWEQVFKDKSDWLLNNVVNTLYCRRDGQNNQYIPNYYLGNRACIREMLSNWLKQFDEVQLVSDVCHYDMVLLIDLFGTAFDLPSNVSASCHDINQDIAKYYGVSEKEAFDKSREEILSEHGIFIDGNKHNALYDAKVIKAIYEVVTK